MLLEFSEIGHRYFQDARAVPSVTQILERAGLVSPFAIDEAAAERGKAVHRLCHMEQTGALDLRKVPKPFKGYIAAWKSWRAIAGYEPIMSEARVDSYHPPYAGTLDSLGVRGPGKIRTLVDIKSGAIGKGTGLQLSAYANAAVPGEKIERVAVQLKPNGTFSCKVYPVETFITDLQLFLIHAENFAFGG